MEKFNAPTRPLIRHIQDEDWQQLEALWLALYEHQQRHGMLAKLSWNAFPLWSEGQKPILQRFGFVFIASDGDAVVGFVAGRIRSLLAHFGGQPVGAMTEIFVAESHRRVGVGKDLLATGIDWFRERGIHRVDLPVLAQSTGAREFYRRLGWVEELVQMVWQDEE